MNKKGLDYCVKWEKAYNKMPNKFPIPSWNDSVVQERIMRMGIEVKMYDVDVSEPNQLERLARATLIEDKLK